MSKPTDTGYSPNVIQLRRAQAVIDPVDDWCANSKYGLLRSNKLDSGKLVRLEDVACWLGKTEPRDNVLNTMFSKLIIDSGLEGQHLFVLNSRSYAKQLIIEDSPNPAVSSWWQFFPEIDSRSSSECIVRDVADGFQRVWPGLCDPETDVQWKTERVIARNKERSAMAAANRAGYDYLGQYWPEDSFLQGLIYAVAIPITKAAELWGYGRIVDEAVQPVSEPVAEPVSPAGKKWTDERLALLLADYKKTTGRTEKEKKTVLSKSWNCSAANIKKYLDLARKADKAAKQASPWAAIHRT